MKLITLASGLALLSLSLTACGGAGSSAIPLTASTGTKAAQSAKVKFTVKLPSATTMSALKKIAAAKASAVRSPRYVSPGTTQVNVLVNGTSNALVCTATACSGTVQAPIGNVTFTINLLDAASVLLSTGTTTQAVTLAGPNTVNVACDGVPASGSVVAVAGNSVTIGTPSTLQFDLTVNDADGFAIIGNLDNISVVLNDTVAADLAHFTLTAPTSSQTAVSVGSITYDGLPVTPSTAAAPSYVTYSLMYSPPGAAAVVLDYDFVNINPIATPAPTDPPATAPA